VWLWESELRERGFRCQSDGYWQCARRYGLAADEYLSLYAWAEQALPDGGRRLVEVSTFHVTFLLGREHVHFYYHEYGENEWHPAGHTSRAEIRRTGQDPDELREAADAVAARLVGAWAGVFHPREA
jgi:hypothetical protein